MLIRLLSAHEMTKHVCKISRLNSKRLQRKLHKILGGYFILPHPVYWQVDKKHNIILQHDSCVYMQRYLIYIQQPNYLRSSLPTVTNKSWWSPKKHFVLSLQFSIPTNNFTFPEKLTLQTLQIVDKSMLCSHGMVQQHHQPSVLNQRRPFSPVN